MLSLAFANPIISPSSIVVNATVSVSELTEPKRITLSLDPGLVLERMILQRLAGLKRRRGHDWLRSLLVQGFLAESRWIRSDRQGNPEDAAPRATTLPATPFADWLERAQPVSPLKTDVPAAVAMLSTPTRGADATLKPFAHLRKVIG